MQTLRKRTWRNPTPRRPRKGNPKAHVETLALEIEVESSHVHVEKNLVKEQKVKVYEKRTRRQNAQILEKEEVNQQEKKVTKESRVWNMHISTLIHVQIFCNNQI